MRVLFYLYVFIGISQSVTYSQPFSIDTVQKMFLYAMEDDDMNAALYRYLSQWNFTDDALLLAYKGSSRAMMARSATWPATKYKYFTEGRDNIEKAIQLQPAHPEIMNSRAFLLPCRSPTTIQGSLRVITGFSKARIFSIAGSIPDNFISPTGISPTPDNL